MNPAVLVMGVSGAGKSSIGAELAARLGARFLEGDDFHPAENVRRMAAGIPLSDADRWPWLDNLGAAMAAARQTGPVVVACSALRRAYRERLRERAGDFTLVCPQVPREVLADRLARRRGHYMPAALLDSQLATLEMPQADEDAITLGAALPVSEAVEEVLRRL